MGNKEISSRVGNVMTEERMIRVNEQGADVIYDALSAYTHNSGLRFMGNPIRWFQLELAPPPDFKPKCYYTTSTTKYFTEEGLRIHIIPESTEPMCVSCDIREKCIYKRE